MNIDARPEKTTSRSPRSQAAVLALGGGLGFWAANLAISLTPIAAEYRTALSISYVPMLIEAALGGLLIGLCVGYSLLRFFDRIPTGTALGKSLLLSGVALVIVTLVIEVPGKLLTATDDALRYFLIGALFNGLRILALGVAIGALHDRLNGRGPRRPWSHDGKGEHHVRHLL